MKRLACLLLLCSFAAIAQTNVPAPSCNPQGYVTGTAQGYDCFSTTMDGLPTCANIRCPSKTNVPEAPTVQAKEAHVLDVSFLKWNSPSIAATVADVAYTCHLLQQPGVYEGGIAYSHSAGCGTVAAVSFGTAVGITGLSAIAKRYAPDSPAWKVLPIINLGLRVTAVALSASNTSGRHGVSQHR